MKTSYQITVDNEAFSVTLEGQSAVVNGQSYDVDAVFMGSGNLSILLDGMVSYAYVIGGTLHPSQYHLETGNPFQINIDGHTHTVVVDDQRSILFRRLRRATTDSSGPAEILAPMPGLVAKILVSKGEQIKQGQGIVVLEAMKMENEIRAQQPGCIDEIRVQPGQAVEKGELLAKIGPGPDRTT